LTVNPYVRRENFREADNLLFVIDRTGNDTGITFPFHQNWALMLSHSLGQNNIRDIRIEYDERWKSFYNQSAVSARLDINYSQPRLNPHRGFRLISGAGYSGLGFGSPYQYYRLSQEARYYYPVHDLFILAGRGAIETMSEIGNSPPIPIEDRLFLGGMQNVRGWHRNVISPVDDSGVSIGGRSSLFCSLEARVPITTNWSTALLYDVGQVSSDSYQFDIDAMSHSLGVGVRYFSPIGVIRFDMAQAIRKEPSSWRFYLTIGESF
jgi:outer membrane protein assembly factor BamA